MPPTLPRQPLAFALICLALAACSSPEERAEQARQALDRAIERGDRRAALEAVDALREGLPDTPDARIEVARQLVRGGDAARANWLLEEGLRRFGDRDDMRFELARVSLLLGNPSRAREVVATIPDGSDQHAAALVLRAQAELGLGDLDQALATLSEAEERYPDQPEARLVRIQTLLSERRFDEAAAAIEAARAALPDDDEQSVPLRHRLEVLRAQLRAQQGDDETAVDALRGMVEADSADRVAWAALLQLLASRQRTAEIIPLLAAALADEMSPPDLLLLLAQVQTSLGHDDEARDALRRFSARSESPLAVVPLVEFLSARGDTEAARDALDEAIDRHPDEALLHLLRAETLLAEERTDEARTEVDRFRETTFDGDPQIDYLEARLALAAGDAQGAVDRLRVLAPKLDRAATQHWLGRALERSGDLEGAERRYALALRRDPAWTSSAVALIALAQRRGDWRTVADLAEGLVRQVPHEPAIWAAWVEALEKLRQGAAAEAVARRALARHPDRAEPHVLLARALRAQGRTDEALAALDRAGALDANADLAAERALTLGQGGRVDEGIALARDALAREPESAGLEATLASLLFAAGDAGAGTRATDRALQRAPDEPRPLRVRCEFFASIGRFSDARDDCTRYLEARPDDAEARFMLGVALESLGESDAAAAAYRRAAQLDERDVRPRNNLAELLARQGDLDGALAAAQEAFGIDEGNAYVADTLGELYRKKGLPERAISLLEDAHAALPVPDVALHLALAYRDAGRTDEARAMLGELQRDAGLRDELRASVATALASLP